MRKDTGGYAFPHDVEERSQNVYGETKTSEYSDPGMTLRDYFAAKAMQVLLNKESLEGYGVVSEHAYLVADRMLEARK